MKNLITALIVVLFVGLRLTLTPVSLAQAPAPCDSEYTVQAGDWLSKIAEKYYSDPLVYPKIVEANNAQADDKYTNIDNPDVIEPGWLLCLIGTMKTASQETGSPAAGSTLAGTSWLLASLKGQNVLPKPQITATFNEDNTLSGSGGCNSYSASYTVEGNSLTIGPAISTQMACPDPIMSQETAYLTVLGSVATYQIQGNTLELADASGATVATFTAMQPETLAGSSWSVIGYNNGNQAVVSVMLDTEITANFGQDGMLTGSTGCNDYSAAYTLNGANITFGPIISTQKFCAEPAGLMEQEQQYLVALQTAATYKIESNRMELRTAAGALAADFVRR